MLNQYNATLATSTKATIQTIRVTVVDMLVLLLYTSPLPPILASEAYVPSPRTVCETNGYRWLQTHVTQKWKCPYVLRYT